MTLCVVNEGSNNTINIEDCSLINGQIKIRGDNNLVSIGKTKNPGVLNVLVQSESQVLIGNAFGFGEIRIYIMSANCSCVIGDSFLVNGSTQITMHEPSRFSAGSDCLIAPGASFLTSDVHSIFDLKTRRRSNLSKDVKIGDHVWIGPHAVILKGASVGNGSVIAGNSVVTGFIPPCSVAGGTPARVLKSNVTWHPELLDVIPPNLYEQAEGWIKQGSKE